MEQLFYTINTKIIIFSDSMRTSEPTLGSEWYYVKMQKSMDTLMVSELVEILSRIRALAGDEFTGAGVIVCQLDAELPTAPLRLGISIPQEEDVATYLAKISKATNDLHDGFHVLAPDLSLISLSQYFSPPVSKTAIINRSRKFGGRYMAALFGSTIPGVLLSGIATKSLGIILFKDGREIFFERT
ncbi:hypothetical protein [Pantoea sp. V108_6]|uniref:hypothetical protein n=1 Tax=Pantoea sp. V108_6 TaxID=3044235 RepID=UPI00249DA957|nr:hypothetical protein [Pantoea sp. V108_6]MDI3366280.1 hypothetical protein [Pantoea sp. V108_6]